jgi:hypothetical protein
MTLQIKSTDAVSGIPIMQVRGFFQYMAAWRRNSFDLPRLRDQLSLDEKSAMALASELVAQGYVEEPQDSVYKFTDKAGELVRASAASKVSRKTAEDALAGLLERVEQYNLDSDKIFTIEAVVVFGSFLGTKGKLGDLDVAVKWSDRNRNDPDRAQTALAYAKQSGRRFGSFFHELAWAEIELPQILKARKRTINIQPWNVFLKMAAKNPERIPYKVVFGNTEEVVAEILAKELNNEDAAKPSPQIRPSK